MDAFTRQLVPASEVTAYVIAPLESDVAVAGVIVAAGIDSASDGVQVITGIERATVKAIDCVRAAYTSLCATWAVIVHEPNVVTDTTGRLESAIAHPAPETELTAYVTAPVELVVAAPKVMGDAPA